MARVDGILSKIRGTLGGIIFYEVNGVTYARQKTIPIKRPPTALKKHFNTKFGMASSFLTPVAKPIAFGYQEFVVGKRTARNAAMSFISKNSFANDGHGLQIKPEWVKLSLGTLTGAKDPKVEWMDEDNIRFTWEDNSGHGSAKEYDKVMVVLYNIEDQNATFKILGNSRSKEEQLLKVPNPDDQRGRLHAYITFHRQNHRTNRVEISDSQYVGLV